MSQLTTLLNRATDILQHAQSGALSHPRGRYILAALPAAVLASLIPSAYRDYQSYLALGPGGPPYNVVGWLCVKLLFNPFRKEMFGTGIYDRKIATGERNAYLDDLPKRNGERPTMGTFAAPQRQRDQLPSQEIKDKLMDAYGAFLARNAHIVDRVPSILERYTDAAHVGNSIPLTPIAAQMKREVCHVHGTSDHSIHVTLSPADSKRVLESGWGQRFTLAGSSVFKNLSFGKMSALPSEYILIYAPRNEEEIEVVMGIVKASVRYVTGSSDVR
ncbi:hypothetical protein BJY01DRAFT_164658 [Aspergillus pseudoustus]|uniref:Luciferase domain-containing protein n=1 Tax=Aspergillus pseudoustus TaxID=1810923 RepID=A0ABR4I9Z2_9EURO